MSSNYGRTPIPLPTIVDDARWIGRFSREVRKSIAALRDRPIITTQQPRGKTGGDELISFRLSVAKVGSDWEWKVSAERSSVTDGTNGAAVDLSGVDFDVGETIAATKFIVLEASIDGSLEPDNWALAAVDDGEEVLFDIDGDQERVQLLIGKITYTDADDVVATQAVTLPQRLIHGLLNGAPVRVFESAPINPADL